MMKSDRICRVYVGEAGTKRSGDYAISSPVTSLQVLEASRLAAVAAAAAAAARQHAFYDRVHNLSMPAGDDRHPSSQPDAGCGSTDHSHSGAFRPVATRFHPYDRRL